MRRRRRRFRPRFLIIVLMVMAAIATVWHERSVHNNRSRSPAAPHVSHSHQKKSTPAVVLHWHRAPFNLARPIEGLTVTEGIGDILAIGGWSGRSLAGITALGPHPVAVSLTLPVHDAASAVLNNTLYVFGGGSSVPIKSIQAIALGSTVAATPPPLPKPLSDLSALTVGHQAYLVGGYTGSAYNPLIYRWAPSSGATVSAVLPQGVRYAGVAWYQQHIIVAGGLTARGISNAVYAANPITGSVHVWPALPVPLEYDTAAVLNGSLFVVGGRSSNGILDQAWRYDPSQRKWVAATPLPVATYYGALINYGGHLYYLGGRTPTGLTHRIWEAP